MQLMELLCTAAFPIPDIDPKRMAHNFINEQDWHDVDVEVALPGRDRTYLLTHFCADLSEILSHTF